MALNCSSILEQTLIMNQNNRKAKQSLVWASFNFAVLAVVLYDLSNICPIHLTYVQYGEYLLAFILMLNILYYILRYIVLSMKIEATKAVLKSFESPQKPVPDTGAKSQPGSPSFTPIRVSSMNASNITMSTTPMNTSAASWRSDSSLSRNLSYSYSPGWNPNLSYSPTNRTYMYRSSPVSPSHSSLLLPPKDTSEVEHITDSDTLNQYLKDFERTEKLTSTYSMDTSTNLLSTFWSHPVTKTAKDSSAFLKKTFYQLSTRSSASSSPSSSNTDEKGSPSQVHVQGIEMWKKMGVDMTRLTLWKENLRLWISKTILERLIAEFDSVNEELQKHGFGDVAIGSVGLDRLRKTAQMSHVAHHIPSLSTLIQFLEITPNQEYLVKRIRELARGGCMSDFKWNGGSSHGGKEWDYSLPTDSAIIMHLFTTYLDTQLMPLPSNPDARPFTSSHFVKSTDAELQRTQNTMAIQQVNEKPPQYRVIVGEEVYELQGYNNLFDSILFFLYHVNKREHGVLGQVNLGKAGLNMLWIIERG